MPEDASNRSDGSNAPHRPTGLRQYLVVALSIELIFSLYYIIKGKAFSFIDIGSDTFFSFYPLQLAVGRQLHGFHDLTWSFDLGLGGYLGTLFDPFWFLTAIFPDSWQLALRLPLFIVKVILAGSFFYGYLRLVGFRSIYATIGALAFSFSSYGTIDVQWDLIIGVEFVQFAAYLYLLEQFLRRQAVWAGVCAGIVLGLGHPMELYSFALFTVVYTLARRAIIGDGNFASYVSSLTRFVLWFMAGLLIAAPILLPAVHYFLESPRVAGDYSILRHVLSQALQVNDRGVLGSEVAGLFGKDMLGTGSAYKGWMNYFEGPGFYVGVLMLVCIPQLLGPQATRRERLLCVGGAIAIAAYFFFPALRFSVYAFGHPGFRFSTLWVSTLLLILGLCGLRRAIETPPWRIGILIAVGGIAALVLACACLMPQITNFQQVARVLGFSAVYAAFLFTVVPLSWRTHMLRPLLFLFACELLLFATPAIVDRDAVSADGSSTWGRYDDGSEQALALIRKLEPSSSFYRIEKTYNSVYLADALVQDYPGIKSYYHHSTSVTHFIDRLAVPRPIQHSNWIGAPNCCHGVLDLVGVKYELTKKRSLDGVGGMTFIATAGGVDIYRNESARSFGYFYEDVASESQADALPPAQRAEFLLQHVVVAEPAEWAAQLHALDAPTEHPVTLQAGAELNKVRDDYIDGFVQTPKAKVLLIAMPFDRAWNARLDDAPLQLFPADYGLTAAVVPAGAHHLQLRYFVPWRVAGYWLSAATIVLLVLIAFFSRRNQQRSRALELVATA
jgi:uncharacterized membrane protein YfhO